MLLLVVRVSLFFVSCVCVMLYYFGLVCMCVIFVCVCVLFFWDYCVSLSFAMGRKKRKYIKEGCFFEEFVFPTRTIDGHDTVDLDLECFEDEDKV
jgi:hypothetical protein